MLAKIDNKPVASDALWWPAMNFNQFRWDGSIGWYELALSRADFLQRLAGAYEQCVRELKEDDRMVPGQDPSPLRDAAYPPLDLLLDNAAARFELVKFYIYEEVFESFLPYAPSAMARFMINSVDEVMATPELVIIRGRGYHGGPGFTLSGSAAL
jgi:hypothetical protein